MRMPNPNAPELAPACFGTAMGFCEGTPECQKCEFAPECGKLTSAARVKLEKAIGLEIVFKSPRLKRGVKVEKAASVEAPQMPKTNPIITPAVDVTGLPPLSAVLVRLLATFKVDLLAAVRGRENPCAGKYGLKALSVAIDLLLAGAFTKAALCAKLQGDLGMQPKEAITNAGIVLPVLTHLNLATVSDANIIPVE